eukprot:Skav206553  [mRNA]  locus=scaffold547:151715:167399:- [translate_table: standard]
MDRKDPARRTPWGDVGTADLLGVNVTMVKLVVAMGHGDSYLMVPPLNGVKVGTKIFWSPEFFDRDYGQKVDVWAMGVIMYGLVSGRCLSSNQLRTAKTPVTGRFPFRDENDVRNKEVRIPKRVHPVCEEYIRKMLEKNEKTRMSSKEVMGHPWIDGKFGKEGDKDADGMMEAGWRERWHQRETKQLQNHKHKKFEVADKIVQGGKASYEWQNEDKVKKDKLLDFENMSPAPKDLGGVVDVDQPCEVQLSMIMTEPSVLRGT